MLEQALLTLESENFYTATYLESARAAALVSNLREAGIPVSLTDDQEVNLSMIRSLGLIRMEWAPDPETCRRMEDQLQADLK